MSSRFAENTRPELALNAIRLALPDKPIPAAIVPFERSELSARSHRLGPRPQRVELSTQSRFRRKPWRAMFSGFASWSSETATADRARPPPPMSMRCVWCSRGHEARSAVDQVEMGFCGGDVLGSRRVELPEKLAMQRQDWNGMQSMIKVAALLHGYTSLWRASRSVTSTSP
jgi:hypothetical protein